MRVCDPLSAALLPCPCSALEAQKGASTSAPGITSLHTATPTHPAALDADVVRCCRRACLLKNGVPMCMELVAVKGETVGWWDAVAVASVTVRGGLGGGLGCEAKYAHGLNDPCKYHVEQWPEGTHDERVRARAAFGTTEGWAMAAATWHDGPHTDPVIEGQAQLLVHGQRSVVIRSCKSLFTDCDPSTCLESANRSTVFPSLARAPLF